jgi:hypothetical protein
VHQHDRSSVSLGLVVQLAARHPQNRHSVIVLRGNRYEGNRTAYRRRIRPVAQAVLAWIPRSAPDARVPLALELGACVTAYSGVCLLGRSAAGLGEATMWR